MSQKETGILIRTPEYYSWGANFTYSILRAYTYIKMVIHNYIFIYTGVKTRNNQYSFFIAKILLISFIFQKYTWESSL